MATCASAMIRLMSAYGIDTVFGIPGVHTVELYRGLKGNRIRHVTPRHEQGAGIMAYGYARASGRPAGCLLITGPGLLNAMTAMGQAYSDSVPMLVIAANNRTSQLGLGEGDLHETADQFAIAGPVTGYAHQLRDAGNLPKVMAQAFASFAGGRPRPAYLEVPRELFAAEVPGEGDAWPMPVRPVAHPDLIARAADLLAQASNPMLLLGGGAAEAGLPALAVAERLSMPVVTTPGGKGIIDERHPLSLGSALPFAPVHDLIDRSDLVLAVGTELATVDLMGGSLSDRLTGKVIRVDVSYDQTVRGVEPLLPIVGDAHAVLSGIADALPTAGDARRKAAEEAVTAARSGFDPFRWRYADRFVPILDRLSAVIDDDAIISVDSTQLAYIGNFYFPSRRPRTWLFPHGYGTLGTGLPAAIGAKLACPDRQVLAIAGDGGLMFTVQDLATAVEEELGIPLIIWNNRAYGEIGDAMKDQGVDPVGVALHTPDLADLAASFGCAASRPQSLSSFADAVGSALQRTVPTLIELDAQLDFGA